jgi:hypothetical protein
VYNEVKNVYEEVREVGQSLVPKSSSSSSSSSNSQPSIIDFTKLDFINFDKIDIKSKKTQNKVEQLLANPEYVITNNSIDRETQASNAIINNFKQKFSDIRTKLVGNLEKYPEKIQSQYTCSLNAIDCIRGKDQDTRDQLAGRFEVQFGTKLEERPILPSDWLPEKPNL